MPDPCRVLFSLDRLAHDAVRRAAAVTGGRAVFLDATAGNGHDTQFLADLAGCGGQVYAFDVQEAAVRMTRKRLAEAGLADRVVLFHAGHERLADLLQGVRFCASMFNLGFLPGSDKRIVTGRESSLVALGAALSMTDVLLTVHAYTGHAGGEAECRAVLDFFAALPRDAWRVQYVTDGNKKKRREWLVLAERIGDCPSA